MRKEIIFKYILRVLVVLLVVGALYNIFFKKDFTVNPMSNETIEYEKVQEVNLSMHQVKTLNPLISTDEDVYYISKLIYGSLFKNDRNMTPVKDLVESYSVNKNTVKIELKKVKFHNGSNLSAEDVLFTVDAIREIGSKSPYYDKVDNIESIEGNGRNLTIVLENVESSLCQLDFPILSSGEYDSYYDVKEDKEEFKPIGTGIYKVSSYDKDKELTLKANDAYYGENASNTVRVKIFKKGSNFIRMTESSNLSVYVDKSEDRETKISKKNIEIADYAGNQIEFIGFNFKNPFLADKSIRQALAYAINCDTIIEEDYYKKIIHSNTVYLPGYLNVEDGQEVYEYDLDTASDILREAGLKDTDDDDILNNKDGREFTLRILVNSNYEDRVSVAERIEDDLESIGIDTTILDYGSKSYKSALKSGKFDIYIGGMSLDNTMNFTEILSTKGKYNYGKFADTKSDEYLAKLYTGKKVEDSAEVLKKYKEYLIEEMPYYCIGYKTFGLIKSPVFEGETRPNFTNPYAGIENWSCNYEVRIPVESEESEEEKESEE